MVLSLKDAIDLLVSDRTVQLQLSADEESKQVCTLGENICLRTTFSILYVVKYLKSPDDGKVRKQRHFKT